MENRMKKLLIIVLALLTALSLSACKKDGDNDDEQKKESLSSINGVRLSEYSIVYSDEDLDYSKRAAEYLHTEILARTGLDLPLIEDSTEPASEYEIVVGETSREISSSLDADTEGLEFAILSQGNHIALEGDYFIIAAAAYYFIDTYVPEYDYYASIPEGVYVHEPIVEKANNFIILIGDGMGVHQTLLHDHLEDVSDYSDGEDLFYGYLLPYIGSSRTESLSGTTDSAAGGTALACGVKTYNDYVGKDRNGEDVESLTELAFTLGKSTAVMSTENKNGATPSTFSAHTISRDNNNEILEDQLALTKQCGTIIDCGYDYYNARYMGVIERHITDTLGKLDSDEDGFFLMYEEAHIDKHCHQNDIDDTFLALIRFNQAIARFMEYAFYNPDTFILITADHETGGLRPDESGALAYSTEGHSLDDVPIFAYGDGAQLFDGREVENIQIAHTIAALMGVDNFGDQTEYASLTKQQG